MTIRVTFSFKYSSGAKASPDAVVDVLAVPCKGDFVDVFGVQASVLHVAHLYTRSGRRDGSIDVVIGINCLVFDGSPT